MAEVTLISWTDSTFNPWRGCTKVSEGCKFCYADRQSKRNPKVLGVWGPQGTRVLASPAQWRQVERWNSQNRDGQRHLVFCASLADVFEDWPGQMTDSQERPLRTYSPGGAPFAIQQGIAYAGSHPYSLSDARARLWELIRRTPRLTWQLLTKRPENIARMMPTGDWPNVWLGVSVENQENAWRLDALNEVGSVRVPVRFCSAEPLIGPLQIQNSLGPQDINWVIVGGESGGQARPMNCDWARSLLSQCEMATVACQIKQLGKSPLPGRLPLRLLTDPGHHGVLDEWPADLQVRQLPSP